MNPQMLIGKTCSFDYAIDGKVQRLTGTITDAKANGTTQRGAIPDNLITVRGKSGKLLTVSQVESYMHIKELP